MVDRTGSSKKQWICRTGSPKEQWLGRPGSSMEVLAFCGFQNG